MEAISNAGAAVGVLARDGVVLAAEKRITSKVREKGGGSALVFFQWGARRERASRLGRAWPGASHAHAGAGQGPPLISPGPAGRARLRP